MSIETNLIGLATFLEKNVSTVSDRRMFVYYGRNVIIKKAYCEVHYGKGGVINGVNGFGLTGTKANYELLPIWAKSRSCNKLPYPFGEVVKNLRDAVYLEMYAANKDEIFEGVDLPPCIEDWYLCLPKVADAIDAAVAEKKIGKATAFDGSFVKFVYDEDGAEVPLTIHPDVMRLMTADSFRLRYRWFEVMGGREDGDKMEDGEVFYDVVDDAKLKLSDLHLGYAGQTLGNSAGLVPVSFNTKESSYGARDCRNYPTSIHNGELIDAALTWLMKPSAYFTPLGENPTQEEYAAYLAARRSQNYTRFTVNEHTYVWFPVLDENSDVEDMEELVDKCRLMQSALENLFTGVISPRLTFTENGEIEDTEANREIVPWIADDEICLYELTVNGKRMCLTERPFSIEQQFRAIHNYNKLMSTCQVNERLSFVKFKELTANENETPVKYSKQMIAKVFGEKFISDRVNTPARRIWREYLTRHILGGYPTSKELLHKIRQKLVYDMGLYHPRFGGKGWKGIASSTMLTELAVSLNIENLDELKSDVVYNIGRTMASLTSYQKKCSLPTSFAQSRLYGVYSGAINLGKELHQFVTFNERVKESRKRAIGLVHDKIRKFKERGYEFSSDMLFKAGVDYSKFYRMNAKTPFGITLAAISSRLGNEAKEDVLVTDENTKTDFGKFIAFLNKKSRELGTDYLIKSDADKSKFILGFYADVFEKCTQQ